MRRAAAVRMSEDACAQVSVALTMSGCGASWWTDLAITLNWKLAATGAALRAGEIDLSRTCLIAEATRPLDDDTARVVEARVLPAAGQQTTAWLRATLRRAVIAADPEGADRRREEAERRAKVSLYPDAEGTASLAGYSLPGPRAAAAMARIGALARAMKATGAGGGMDLLRAQVFLGLLLGTLPYIPPAPGSPPDNAAPNDPESDGPAPDGPAHDGPEPDGPEPDDPEPQVSGSDGPDIRHGRDPEVRSPTIRGQATPVLIMATSATLMSRAPRTPTCRRTTPTAGQTPGQRQPGQRYQRSSCPGRLRWGTCRQVPAGCTT